MSGSDADAGRVRMIRIGTGLVQGLALYLLVEASIRHAWPSTDPVLNRALYLVFYFVPLIVMQGVSLVRLPRLIAWAAAATVIAAGLGGYSAWRQLGAPQPLFFTEAIALNIFTAAGFFIAHALIVGADMDRRFMATYPTHFDVAWKLALQLANEVPCHRFPVDGRLAVADYRRELRLVADPLIVGGEGAACRRRR